MNALVLALTLAATAPEGQTVAVKRLSVEDAVRLAVAASERVRSAAQDLHKARGQIAEARAAALPHVSAEIGYSRFSGGGGMYPPELVTMGFLPSFSSQYTASVKMQQLVYNGGIVVAALRAAALAEEQSELGLELSRKGAVYAAQMAYAAVLAQAAILDVAKESEDLAASSLTNARALKAAGIKKTLDVKQALVELQNAKSQRFKARTAHRMARDALLRILGLDLGRDVALVDSLESLTPPADLDPIDDYLTTARGKRLDLDIAAKLEQLNKLIYDTSTSSRRPTAGLQVAYAATSGEDWFHDDFEFDWLVGMQVKIPIFDGLAAQGKKRQAHANLEKARIEIDRLRRDIEKDVRSAYWRVRSAGEFAATAAEGVNVARDAVQEAENLYRADQVPAIVPQQSRLGLAQARTNLAQARFELFAAMLDLKMSAGLIEAPPAK